MSDWPNSWTAWLWLGLTPNPLSIVPLLQTKSSEVSKQESLAQDILKPKMLQLLFGRGILAPTTLALLRRSICRPLQYTQAVSSPAASRFLDVRKRISGQGPTRNIQQHGNDRATWLPARRHRSATSPLPEWVMAQTSGPICCTDLHSTVNLVPRVPPPSSICD